MKAGKLLIISALLLTGYRAQAQEIFKFNSGGGGFNFTMGTQGVSAEKYFSNDKATSLSTAVDDPLAQPDSIQYTATFSAPKSSIVNFGFQSYGLFNSIMMGGELNFGIGGQNSGVQQDKVKKANYGTTSSQFVSSSILYQVGLLAFRKRGFVAYPMLGLGYGASGVLLKASDEQRVYPQITNVVTERNQQNMFVWTSNMVLDFGLGAQFLAGKATEDNARGFSIGFRVGYNVQLATEAIKVQWLKNAKDSYKTPTTLPSIGNSGFYAKVLIGFGRIGENR
jgi:hypothetical protein